MDTIDISDLALEGRRTKGAIYAVEHTSGKRYIGSATNLSRRLWDTQAALEKRSHHNKNLNDALVAEGADNFKLVVLELVDDLKLLPVLKRLHIEHARSTCGAYNPEPRRFREKIVIDPKPAEAVAERRKQEAAQSLDAALERMSGEARRKLVDRLVGSWRRNHAR